MNSKPSRWTVNGLARALHAREREHHRVSGIEHPEWDDLSKQQKQALRARALDVMSQTERQSPDMAQG